MKAMIMAAGVGSRLMPLTANLPKPMVPVANRPVMEHAVNLLKRYGITEIIANLHYLPETIKDYFGYGYSLGVSLKYSEEKNLLGTAGGVKNNEWFLDDTFVILSGDGLTDVNLEELIRFHKMKGSLATIALKEVDNVEQFGVVITDEEGKIKSFQEKPKKDEALSNLVNTGIYIFEPEIFKYIPEGQVFDFGKDLFPLLVEEELPFYGYEMQGYWCDVGSLEEYRNSNSAVLDQKVDVLVPTSVWRKNAWCGKNVHIHPTAKIHGNVLISDGVKIGPDVEIFGNVIIGNNSKIDERAIIQNCVLWENVTLGSDAILNECIIGKGSVIEQGAVVRKGSCLGDNCVVEAFAEILSDQKLETGSLVHGHSVAG